jgi:hypothetical protein
MANDISQQISATEALAMAAAGPQEAPLAPASTGDFTFQQKFEVREITALLKELGDEEWVHVAFAYDADASGSDYKWLNGVIFSTRALLEAEADTQVDPDHVAFLTTMLEDASQVYPHQINAQTAAEIRSLGFQWGKQAFHVSGIFALLSTIESEPSVDGKKWVYVYYAYNQSMQLQSVILGSRLLASDESCTLKDPRKVEFLEHTNDYPMF